METITIELTKEQYQIVLAALEELPIKIAAGTYNALMQAARDRAQTDET